MVQPPGVVTSSLRAAGWRPVASTISAAPNVMRVTSSMAAARGRPHETAPSVSASSTT